MSINMIWKKLNIIFMIAFTTFLLISCSESEIKRQSNTVYQRGPDIVVEKNGCIRNRTPDGWDCVTEDDLGIEGKRSLKFMDERGEEQELLIERE